MTTNSLSLSLKSVVVGDSRWTPGTEEGEHDMKVLALSVNRARGAIQRRAPKAEREALLRNVLYIRGLLAQNSNINRGEQFLALSESIHQMVETHLELK